MLLLFHLRIYLLILTLALGSVLVGAEITGAKLNKASFDVAPVPLWVKSVEPDRDVDVDTDTADIVYLLADRQENVQRNAFYFHEVHKIMSDNGRNNGASISAPFDPTFEKLTFHSIKLTRNGTTSNRLDRSRIKLVQKETDPERAMYDPSFTAQLLLDDVRVGDIVEFAFSREGANPWRRGKCATSYLLQWGTMVVRNVVRVVFPTTRKLLFRAENSARAATVTTTNGLTELWYEEHNVPGRTIEDSVADGYEPRPHLDITEFHTWAELAQWAVPLFQTEPPHSDEFNAEIEQLRSISAPEQRVVAALQFVQDKIRYVKIGSWFATRPLTAPDEVLRRGFGNHMDKALLLVTLLRRTQIDAAPALVSGSFGGAVEKLLPSPDVLDQVLVQVRIGEATYWLRPAASGQRGPLSQIYVPAYDYALVLRNETTGLTRFEPPSDSFPVTRVIDNYRVPPPDKIAELEVITEYRGLAADRTRAFFRENTREEIQKRYLEYYTRSFPDAKAQKPPWYEELPGENACRVIESYILPRLWQLNDEKNRYTFYLQPLEMYSALGSTISPQRQDPFKLEYPNVVSEEVNVQMFDDWPLNADNETMTNEFFRLRHESSGDGPSLQFRFTYETLKDRVDVSEIEKFNEEISKAKDRFAYAVKYQTPEQIKKAKSVTAFNWGIASGTLCFFVAASFLAYSYFRHSKLAQPHPPPIEAAAQLNGIGGWLVLLAIAHVLLPLRFIKPLWDVSSATMDTASWRALTDPIESTYSPWWAPALLFELFFNIGALVFAVLLVALFFTRKAAWRRAFPRFLILFVLAAAIDAVLVNKTPSAAEPLLMSLLAVAPIVLFAAISIPYVSMSQRVKATFRY